jgi:hypothetical protein
MLLCDIVETAGSGEEWQATLTISNVGLGLNTAFEEGYLQFDINTTNLNIDCMGDAQYTIVYQAPAPPEPAPEPEPIPPPEP